MHISHIDRVKGTVKTGTVSMYAEVRQFIVSIVRCKVAKVFDRGD